MSENFSFLESNKFISLTTFYKSGKGVSTPVEFVISDGIIFVATNTNSYKVKRIYSTGKGTIAPCNMRGKVKGNLIDVKVRVLSENEEEIAINAMKQIFDKKLYKIGFFLGKLRFWKSPVAKSYLEITT